MVTLKERKLIIFLLKIKVFGIYEHFRQPQVSCQKWIRWFHKWLLNRQVVDNYHHAPMCPANHWHKKRFVFEHCSCGAEFYERELKRYEKQKDSIEVNNSPDTKSVKV